MVVALLLQWGIVIGVGISLLLLLYPWSRPQFHVSAKVNLFRQSDSGFTTNIMPTINICTIYRTFLGIILRPPKQSADKKLQTREYIL